MAPEILAVGFMAEDDWSFFTMHQKCRPSSTGACKVVFWGLESFRVKHMSYHAIYGPCYS